MTTRNRIVLLLALVTGLVMGCDPEMALCQLAIQEHTSACEKGDKDACAWLNEHVSHIAGADFCG